MHVSPGSARRARTLAASAALGDRHRDPSRRSGPACFTQWSAVQAFVDEPELGTIATGIKGIYASMATGFVISPVLDVVYGFIGFKVPTLATPEGDSEPPADGGARKRDQPAPAEPGIAG